MSEKVVVGIDVSKSRLDCFAHPFWEAVRTRIADKSIEMRKQGFFGAAMLPMTELEYTGIVEKIEALTPHSRVRTEQ